MDKLYWNIRNLIECPREEGQTLTEYALIIALVVIAVIVVLGALGGQIRTIFQAITAGLGPATP